MTTELLTTGHLNRALLARQMLLERSDLDITQVVEGMGGIQMQYAPAGYVGLWSRMRAFDRPMLTAALEDRRLVQATLMRVTIHTVSAADYWPMLAGIRRVSREWFTRVQPEMRGVDMAAVAGVVRDALAAGPLRMADLTQRVVDRGYPPRAAGWAGLWVDMVRVPPSGTWERRRADLYGLADQWIPRVEATEDDGIELLIRRYLGAFGPAPLRDIANWMGLNVGQIRPVADRMSLRPLRHESGAALFDLPDGLLPDPDTPAPVRFLAVWDAMLLVHARRTEVLPERYRAMIFNTRSPHSFNTFLVDGQVAGTWRFDEGRVSVAPFAALPPNREAEVAAEAEALERFHA